MIQYEWQTVKKREYEAILDDLGQKSKGTYTDTNVQMVVKIYSQNNVENPLYTGVQLIGITEDFTISTQNDIVIDNKVYHIKFTIPSGRYLQVMMTNE